MKKICSLLLVISLLLSLNVTAFAQESENVESSEFNPSTVCTKFDYTILDAEGNIIDSGYIDFSSRLTWSNITISNGQQFTLKPSGSNYFSASVGTNMRFKFTLNRQALTAYYIVKHKTGSAIWKGNEASVTGGYLYVAADETAGYTGLIINRSSDPFTITYAEFSF